VSLVDWLRANVREGVPVKAALAEAQRLGKSATTVMIQARKLGFKKGPDGVYGSTEGPLWVAAGMPAPAVPRAPKAAVRAAEPEEQRDAEAEPDVRTNDVKAKPAARVFPEYTKADAEATHARWAREHIAANPGTVFNAKYKALAAKE
jgi:hypothetical protein